MPVAIALPALCMPRAHPMCSVCSSVCWRGAWRFSQQKQQQQQQHEKRGAPTTVLVWQPQTTKYPLTRTHVQYLLGIVIIRVETQRHVGAVCAHPLQHHQFRCRPSARASHWNTDTRNTECYQKNGAGTHGERGHGVGDTESETGDTRHGKEE